MIFPPRELVSALNYRRARVFAYGPPGHEIVGGIADKVIANTPAAKKVYAFTDGITLERASVIADELKGVGQGPVSMIQTLFRITRIIQKSTSNCANSGVRILRRRTRRPRFHHIIGFITRMCPF